MNKHRSLSILISDADKTVQHTIGGYLSLNGHQVDFADSSSGLLDRVDASDYDFALVDIALPGLSTFDLLSGIWKLRPDLPVIFMAAPNKLYLEMGIKAFRNGATDVLIKPVKIPEVDALLEFFAPSSLSDTDEGSATSQLIGISAPISQVREHIRRVVEANCKTILITGETGTGKEVVAQEIHRLAHAESAPFIAVSCPVLTPTLMESELFGSVKGSFTSATEN